MGDRSLNFAADQRERCFFDNAVEVIGRYSNHCEQGERLRDLVEMLPNGPSRAKVQTKKQIHRRLRRSEIDELLAGYKAGATVYQLAERFGIHRETVSLLLERERIPRRNRPLSPVQIEQARELYATGQSLAKVGGQLGCDANTVRIALVRVGVRMRDCRGRER
jgi:site-specific DNA recombinase